MKEPPDRRCSLLVLSCDAYRDLWPPFFNILQRHWPDCPFPIYLGAGDCSVADEGVTTLSSPAGKDWSSCVLDYLTRIPTDYVLVMLDDFFLRKRVKNAMINRCLAFAQKFDAYQLRLIPRPGPTKKIAGERSIGLLEPGSRYRISAQAAIWNRLALMRLLRPGETAWEFENNAAERVYSDFTKHYAVWRAVLPYEGFLAHHVIEKGRWLPHEKWIFGRQNIGCDFSDRATLGWGQTFQCHLAGVIAGGLRLLPPAWGESLRLLIRRIAGRVAPQLLARLGGVRGKPQ